MTWQWDDTPTKVHDHHDCRPKPCPWHAPSAHALARHHVVVDDTGAYWRVCGHNQRHPDYDYIDYMCHITNQVSRFDQRWHHDCDGCCAPWSDIRQEDYWPDPN